MNKKKLLATKILAFSELNNIKPSEALKIFIEQGKVKKKDQFSFYGLMGTMKQRKSRQSKELKKVDDETLMNQGIEESMDNETVVSDMNPRVQALHVAGSDSGVNHDNPRVQALKEAGVFDHEPIFNPVLTISNQPVEQTSIVPQNIKIHHLNTGTEETVRQSLTAAFELIDENIIRDNRRRTMFEMWSSTMKYDGNIGDFLIDAFDEFMMLRGITIKLIIPDSYENQGIDEEFS